MQPNTPVCLKRSWMSSVSPCSSWPSVMVFFYAPLEAVMGEVQSVFYFHVATGWVGMLGFLVAGVAGVVYLLSSERKWDVVGLAAVEIGLVFMFIAIITGSIWARPIWNTWWTWDPRLTTATIMELVYAAYLMLRQGIEDPDRRARFGAVYAIVGLHQRAADLLLDPHLPHHPPGGDRQRRPDGAGRFRHDAADAADLPVQPVRLLDPVHRPAVAPHPPGDAGR